MTWQNGHYITLSEKEVQKPKAVFWFQVGWKKIQESNFSQPNN